MRPDRDFTMGIAFYELYLLLALLGGLLLPNPIGVPPLPEDPRLLGCAPAGTLAYVQWFGMAEPNPRSPNRTEKLAAEPDVREFFRAASHAFATGLAADAGDREEARQLIELGQFAVVRPGCAFVVGDPSSPATVGWGLVMNVGDQAERVRELSESIVASFQDDGPTRAIAGIEFQLLDAGGAEAGWAVHGEHVAFAFGRAALEAVASGLGSARGLVDNPRFSKSHSRVEVARPSLRMFVDIEALVAKFGAMDPDTRVALDAFGISSITAYTSESGLEAGSYVGRSMLSTSERGGMLEMLDGPTLDASSLALVPADATIASVVRIDAAQAWQLFFDSIRAIDPREAEQAERDIDDAMQFMFELDLEDDLLAHLGDTWALWSSPSQGSLLMLGACACVTLDDPDAFTTSFEQLMDRVRAMNPDPRPRDEWGRVARGVYIEELDFDGTTIHWMNTVGDDVPFAPAWCVHDGKLWAATFPQVLQSALATPKGAPTLAGADGASTGFGARMFSRADMRAVLETVYSPLMMLGQLACSQMQRDGIEFDVTAFPRLPSVLPHVGIETLALTVEPDGLVAMSRGTIPHLDPGLGIALPFAGIMPYWMMSRQFEMARAVEMREAAEAAEQEAARRKRDGGDRHP